MAKMAALLQSHNSQSAIKYVDLDSQVSESQPNVDPPSFPVQVEKWPFLFRILFTWNWERKNKIQIISDSKLI